MRNEDVGRELLVGTAEYASLADRTSRTGARARVLGLIDKLRLAPDGAVRVRSVDAEELRAGNALRGAVVMHLDLASRSAITSTELIYTATRGRVFVAEHEELAGFPIGVALALPSVRRIQGRRELFAASAPTWADADTVTLYALATNPGRVGAGTALVATARAAVDGRALVAYAPLTGLRARIIQLVDDEPTWKAATEKLADIERRMLLRQLTDLLVCSTMPDLFDEPGRSVLAAEARRFAADDGWAVGRFHRHMGARLGGVDDGADPSDSDAMWARAFFDY